MEDQAQEKVDDQAEDVVIELLDQSASAALEHAAELQQHLRAAGRDHTGVAECHAEMHRLVADIVSLRNAAELLKRQAASPDQA